MAFAQQPIVILVADDDEEDRMLMREAFDEGRLANDLRFVADGEELMQYLRRRGRYAEPWTSPRPGLLLLDLNMPRKGGHECLAEIKADPSLSDIPVVVLTTSGDEDDVHRTFETGASSYLRKPVLMGDLLDLVLKVTGYRLQLVSEG